MTAPNRSTRRSILANLLVHGRLDKHTVTGNRRGDEIDLLPGDDPIAEDTFDTARKWLVDNRLATWESNLSRRGRPKELRVGSAWGYGIGVVVGHESLRCGIGNGRGEILADEDGDLAASSYMGDVDAASATDVLDRAADLCVEVFQRSKVPQAMVRGVTVALPWPVDRNGRLANGRGLRGFAEVSVPREVLADALAERGLAGVNVEIDNDANATGLGEWHSRLMPAGPWVPLVAIKVSGGVGASLISEYGRVLRGAAGVAGEIGHVPVDVGFLDPVAGLADLQPDVPCRRCGAGRAHLESYVSATAVLARVYPGKTADELAGSHGLLTETLEDPAHADHDRMTTAVLDAGRILGRALRPIVEFVDPGLVVVAGRMRAAGQVFTEAIGGELAYSGRALDEPPPVIASEHGLSGVMGAIRNALENNPPPLPQTIGEVVIKELLEDMRVGPRAWQVASPLLGQIATSPGLGGLDLGPRSP